MRWLDAPIRLFTVRPVPDLAAAGQEAVRRADNLWHSNIYDPRKSDDSIAARFSKKHISNLIQDGLGWDWEPDYLGDGSFEWCGAFVADCWGAIKLALRRDYFASTYRLDRYARYASVNGKPNKGSGRLIAELDERSTELPWGPRAGDILTIGPTGSGYGKHICLVERFDPQARIFETIEGNGTGIGPDGRMRQGVVRARRHLGGTGIWHARRLIRPSVSDLG